MKKKHKKAEHNRRRNSPSKMAIHQVAKKQSSMNVTQLQECCEAHEGLKTSRRFFQVLLHSSIDKFI